MSVQMRIPTPGGPRAGNQSRPGRAGRASAICVNLSTPNSNWAENGAEHTSNEHLPDEVADALA